MWRRRSDLLLPAGLLLLAEGEALGGGYDDPAVLALGGVGISACLTLRRRAPLLSVAGLVVVLAAMTAAGATTNTVTVIVAYVVWSLSLGLHAPTRVAAVGLLVLLASSWAAIWFTREDAGAGDLVFVTVLLGGAAVAGQALRHRRHEVVVLGREAEEAREERDRLARQAVLEERSRIARELHDVVAHSVSVMVMQTGVVRRRLTGVRPDDADLLDEVERTGREALGEMRRMVGLLRTDEEQAILLPQPGVDRIGSLVEQVREAGLPVSLRVVGEQVPLPPGLDLAAYRVVQEGLTNTLKHAGSARAEVLLRYGAHELELRVDDDGQVPPDSEGSGHGLVGMRERVDLYGGTLTTGPRPDGGFQVHAVLPLERVP